MVRSVHRPQGRLNPIVRLGNLPNTRTKTGHEEWGSSKTLVPGGGTGSRTSGRTYTRGGHTLRGADPDSSPVNYPSEFVEVLLPQLPPQWLLELLFVYEICEFRLPGLPSFCIVVEPFGPHLHPLPLTLDLRVPGTCVGVS